MLSELKNKRLVWLANEKLMDSTYVNTGYKEFDIHYQGLPSYGLIEVQTQHGWGEISLLINYLKHKQADGLLVIVNPPGILTCEFLLQHGINIEQLLFITSVSDIDALWAVEQCLKSGVCGALILWKQDLSFKEVRRLNLACEQEQVGMFIIRAPQDASIPGSIMSFQLQPELTGLKIQVKRQRGRSLKIDPIISSEHLWPSKPMHFGQNLSLKSTSFGG